MVIARGCGELAKPYIGECDKVAGTPTAVWVIVAFIAFLLVLTAITEVRRYRWNKRNRRGGFITPTGKRRL